MSDTTALADGFDPVDRARWRELVAAAMRRSNGDVAPDDVERLLVTPTDDGYAVHPLYTAEDVASFPAPHDPGRFDFVRGATTADESIGWDVRARHWLDADSPAAIADDLANGVTEPVAHRRRPGPPDRRLGRRRPGTGSVVVEGFRAGHRLASALLELDRPLNPGPRSGWIRSDSWLPPGAAVTSTTPWICRSRRRPPGSERSRSTAPSITMPVRPSPKSWGGDRFRPGHPATAERVRAE